MRHVLIIGGTRGLGKEAANHFAERGFAVSVIGRTDQIPSSNSSGSIIQYWFGNLFDKQLLNQTLDEIVEKQGKINYIVFCQRYRGTGDTWVGEFDVSLSLTKALVEGVQGRFDPSGDRSIVMVSSVFGDFVGTGQDISYHVGKAALNQMMRFYAVNLGRKGIRVNAVTPFTFIKEESKNFYASNERLQSLYEKIVPLGRMPTASDVVKLIAFLCSPDSFFVNGQNIYVDGGLSLTWQESLARNLTQV